MTYSLSATDDKALITADKDDVNLLYDALVMLGRDDDPRSGSVVHAVAGPKDAFALAAAHALLAGRANNDAC